MGQLISYSSVFEDSLIDDLHGCVEKTDVCKTNYSFWDNRIVKASSAILIFDLPKSIENTLVNRVKELHEEIGQCKKVFVMYYKMMPGAYIPWHNDSKWSFGMTVYLNKNWDRDFGGYFAFAHDNQIRCLPPEYNNAIFVSTPLEHCVFQIAPDAPPRTTIQIFGR